MSERARGGSSITTLRTLYYLVKISVALILLPQRSARSDVQPS